MFYKNEDLSQNVPDIKSTLPKALLSLAVGCMFLPSISNAAIDDTVLEITIEKQGKVSQTKVALVPFTGNKSISTIILNDLQGTSLDVTSSNLIQQPHSSAELSATLPAWQRTGLSHLVVGKTSNQGGNVVVDFEVVELATGRILANEAVKERTTQKAAHKTAARIYKIITGKDSDFNARIIYVEEVGVGAKKTSSLVMRDANGQNAKLLARVTNGSIFSPAVSPDGRYVAYSVQLKNRHAQLFKSNLHSLQVTKLATNLKGDSLSPSFSPNGNQIVFSNTEDGDADIYQTYSNGGSASKILEMPYDQVQPSYNPRDGSIVFASDHANPNRPNIYRYKFSGSPTRVSRSTYAANPRFNSDGTKIAYLNGSSAAVMDTSGRNIANFGNTGIDEAPAFSPSGENVVYSRGKGKSSLVIRSLEGGKTIIKPMGGTVRSPVWVPSND